MSKRISTSSVKPLPQDRGVIVQRQLRSRGRIYLHKEELEHLFDDVDPWGQTVYVAISVPQKYDPISNWSMYDWTEGFVKLGQYNEFTVPIAVREQFDLSEGDDITLFVDTP